LRETLKTWRLEEFPYLTK